MKIILISLACFSFSLFAQEGKPMHDHSKMEKMHSKHHSMSHTSAPIGVMGSMHHSGFMISLKQGLMKMNGNIFDGKNISNSDISFSTLFHINQIKNSRWHGEASFKKSIGSDDSMAQVLTPMGKEMNMIMPYAMQPGDSSSSLIFGLTNTRKLNGDTLWVNQIKRKIVVSESSWSFGDQTEFNSWIQHPLSKQLSISSRLKFVDQDALSGGNAVIMAPVQTANPKNYGGTEAFIDLGMNLNLDAFFSGNNSIGIEILKPVNQNKNNLQMKTDYQVIIGYQKSF